MKTRRAIILSLISAWGGACIFAGWSLVFIFDKIGGLFGLAAGIALVGFAFWEYRK